MLILWAVNEVALCLLLHLHRLNPHTTEGGGRTDLRVGWTGPLIYLKEFIFTVNSHLDVGGNIHVELHHKARGWRVRGVLGELFVFIPSCLRREWSKEDSLYLVGDPGVTQ
jgi:hypothetical protein